MRAPRNARRALCSALAATAVLACAGTAAAAAPPPCGGTPQINDASGDGHHPSSDVLAAWLAESSGGLQAVIKVRAGDWKPEHTDADVNGSGFALLFALDGRTAYVRASAAEDGTLTYDYGTYTAPSTFTRAGATTGAAVYGVGGTVTIDVPPTLGATPGKVLGGPFVLTYDGIVGGEPTWVDHAPGGTAPADAARGADFVVGSCGLGGLGSTSGGGAVGALPGQTSGSGAPGGGATATPGALGGVTSVTLTAPRRLVGGGTATITGRIAPARAGVDVAVTRRGAVTETSHTRTSRDGTFKVRVAVRETVEVRAKAAGLRSATQTITVASKVRLRATRLRGGRVRIDGTYAPALPGRALLLRRVSARPVATRAIAKGRFSFTFARGHAPRGDLQVVVVPSRSRAGRATSNTVNLPGK
jgi:hypothetical protein